jgi:hypothetical protein
MAGCLLVCCAVRSGRSLPTFKKFFLPPIIRPMIETVSTSETSVNYRTTLRNKPENSDLHIRRRENLKVHFY